MIKMRMFLMFFFSFQVRSAIKVGAENIMRNFLGTEPYQGVEATEGTLRVLSHKKNMVMICIWLLPINKSFIDDLKEHDILSMVKILMLSVDQAITSLLLPIRCEYILLNKIFFSQLTYHFYKILISRILDILI